MKKFLAGFIAGILATVLFAAALLIFWTGPILDVSVSVPESVEMTETFDLIIHAVNPHGEVVALDNVDIPESFFDLFEVVSVTPEASSSSPVGGMGTKTWYFEIDVLPQGETSVVFKLKPLKEGQHVIDLEVCNATEDGSQIVKSITVL